MPANNFPANNYPAKARTLRALNYRSYKTMLTEFTIFHEDIQPIIPENAVHSTKKNDTSVCIGNGASTQRSGERTHQLRAQYPCQESLSRGRSLSSLSFFKNHKRRSSLARTVLNAVNAAMSEGSRCQVIERAYAALVRQGAEAARYFWNLGPVL